MLFKETLVRIVRLGVSNFWRNSWLTAGATLLMTLTLTMISVSLLITFMIGDTANAVRSSINLTLYFRDDTVTDQKIMELSERIRKIPEVSATEFVSKKDALAIFKRLPINPNVKDPVSEEFNPLPRSLEVETNNVERLNDTVKLIEQADTDKLICGECLSYRKNKEIVDQLISSTKTAQQGGWLLSAFFGLIAIFNVYNIIRLTIAARSDEIEIMRYVGASNSFIRGPFIVEGIMYGFLGTVLSTILVPLMAYLITYYRNSGSISSLSGAFSILNTNLFTYVVEHIWVMIAIQLIIGVVLGVFVSLLSIRRYLKA